MKIQLFSHIRNPRHLEQIRQLLILCDTEFVPPLSGRSSTTQMQLQPTQSTSPIPEEYFRTIATQSAVLALEKDQVVGFMSFRENYVCEYISSSMCPNLYITTVIVHPDYRHQGITTQMYRYLRKKNPRRYLFTRTWSTNLSHIRILSALGFLGHCTLYNDRGKDIDTIYFRSSPKQGNLKQYIKQYHLSGNLFFFAFLVVFTLVCLVAWFYSDGGLFRELALAIATSLMASVMCLASDTYLKIRESQNDAYINKLKSFGIENLQFNKNELLESIIPHCRKEIWISGYRLIMTGQATFRHAMITASKRSKGLSIKLLAVPPWYTAYHLTYGQEDVTLNYLKVLRDLLECRTKYGLRLEVRFSQRPLFSDTYKVDNRFITGPYLHCVDEKNARIAAKDFFSLDISQPGTALYKIMHSDYMTLWDEAVETIDLNLLEQKITETPSFESLTTAQRQALLQECCKKL